MAEVDLSPSWTYSENEISDIEHAAWEAGLRHALAWLGLKQYGDVMTKDNPHKETSSKNGR